MKKLSVILVFILLTTTASFASNYSSDPKTFIEELVNDAIKLLSDKNNTKEEKTISIEKIALENVDIKALGLYTLGELRKTASKQSLSKYQETFEKIFLKKFNI